MNDLYTVVQLSWTSFRVPNLKGLEKVGKEMDECYKSYEDLEKQLTSVNELIKGKFKIDGKEVLYEKCEELIKTIHKDLVSSTSNYSAYLVKEGRKIKSKVLIDYETQTQAKLNYQKNQKAQLPDRPAYNSERRECNMKIDQLEKDLQKIRSFKDYVYDAYAGNSNNCVITN